MTKLQILVDYLKEKGFSKDSLNEFTLENFYNQDSNEYTFLDDEYVIYSYDQINQQLDDYFFDELDEFLNDNRSMYPDIVNAIRNNIRSIDSPYYASDYYDLLSSNLIMFKDYFIEQL